jgi:hypothetical protein
MAKVSDWLSGHEDDSDEQLANLLSDKLEEDRGDNEVEHLRCDQMMIMVVARHAPAVSLIVGNSYVKGWWYS